MKIVLQVTNELGMFQFSYSPLYSFYSSMSSLYSMLVLVCAIVFIFLIITIFVVAVAWFWQPAYLFLQPFPYLGSAHRVFNLHVLWNCASSSFTPFSFMSFLITSLHPSFGLPIFRFPPTSIFHVLITTSCPILTTMSGPSRVTLWVCSARLYGAVELTWIHPCESVICKFSA